MAAANFDPNTLSVEERLALIDRLWISILEDAGRGDELATQALDMDHGLDPEVIEELEQRADELERAIILGKAAARELCKRPSGIRFEGDAGAWSPGGRLTHMATPVVSTEARSAECRDPLSTISRQLWRQGLSAPRFALRSRRRNYLMG